MSYHARGPVRSGGRGLSGIGIMLSPTTVLPGEIVAPAPKAKLPASTGRVVYAPPVTRTAPVSVSPAPAVLPGPAILPPVNAPTLSQPVTSAPAILVAQPVSATTNPSAGVVANWLSQAQIQANQAAATTQATPGATSSGAAPPEGTEIAPAASSGGGLLLLLAAVAVGLAVAYA